MPLIDRGGRWHVTVPGKGNRWLDMPDIAMGKLADLLEDDAKTRETAKSVTQKLDNNDVQGAQDEVQKYMDEFPFEDIMTQEQERAWTDSEGNDSSGPVEKVHEALQAFVAADPAAFEKEAEDSADAPEAKSDAGDTTLEAPKDSKDGEKAVDATAAKPADDISKQIEAARAAIEELKNSGLSPEQAAAVDRALKEINGLGDAKPTDGSTSDPQPDPAPAEAKPADDSMPQETPGSPSESDPANADGSSEIAGVAALKKAFEDGYSTSDESIWQGKAGKVEIGTLADGTKVVRKAAPNEEEADKEALIGLVANVLGVDVSTAKIGKNELVTNHIQGKTGNEWLRQQMNDGNPSAGPGGGKAEKLGRWKQDGAFEKKMVREMKGAKAVGLLDYLVENPDRHAGNWMVRGDNEIVPIDHGNSTFAPLKFTKGDQELVWFNGSPFSKYWLGMQTGKYREIKSMDPGQHWTKEELVQFRGKLEGLKDEFSSRPEWHTAIMANIDNVLEYIK